jgi:hypothetical protein
LAREFHHALSEKETEKWCNLDAQLDPHTRFHDVALSSWLALTSDLHIICARRCEFDAAWVFATAEDLLLRRSGGGCSRCSARWVSGSKTHPREGVH